MLPSVGVTFGVCSEYGKKYERRMVCPLVHLVEEYKWCVSVCHELKADVVCVTDPIEAMIGWRKNFEIKKLTLI